MPNQQADAVQSLIHKIIVEILCDVAINLALAEAPWLNIPVVKQVFVAVTRKGFGVLSEAPETAAAFAVIDSQVAKQDREYQESLAALKAAQAQEDANAKARAREEYKAALARLIHSNRP